MSSIVDSGPPLHLNEIGQEQLLDLMPALYFPEAVKQELERFGVWERVKYAASKVEVIPVEETEIRHWQKTLNIRERADASIKALAYDRRLQWILTDDLSLRRILEGEGHSVVGTVGILLRAYKVGRLTDDKLDQAVEKLFNNSTLYLSEAFKDLTHRYIAEYRTGKEKI